MTTYTGVSPYLFYADAAAALDWLERVFGFGPRQTWGEDGKVDEAHIQVGPQKIMMTNLAPGPDQGGGSLLVVHVDDVDALHERVRAALEGEQEVAPPEDKDYGPRTFDVTDPWGYHWYFWQGEAG